jgi:hypothetical protein
MSILSELSNNGNELTIKINSPIDLDDADIFRKAYEEQNHLIPTYTIYFDNPGYCNYAFLGMLLALNKYIEGSHSKIKIVNSGACIQHLLKATILNKVYILS